MSFAIWQEFIYITRYVGNRKLLENIVLTAETIVLLGDKKVVHEYTFASSLGGKSKNGLS